MSECHKENVIEPVKWRTQTRRITAAGLPAFAMVTMKNAVKRITVIFGITSMRAHTHTHNIFLVNI